MDIELFNLHNKYKKHKCAKLFKFYDSDKRWFTYMGLCACGALYAWQNSEDSSGTRAVFMPTSDKMTLREHRYWCEPWIVNALKLIKKTPELLEAYKYLPYVEGSSYGMDDDDVLNIMNAEHKVFGAPLEQVPGLYHQDPAKVLSCYPGVKQHD